MRGLLAERPEDRLAGALVGWIKTHGGRTTVREVVRGHAVGIRSYSVAQDALDTLADRGLVIVESERKNSLVYRILTPEELSTAV